VGGQEEFLERARTASLRAGVASFFGLIVVIATLLYSAARLYTLRAEYIETDAELAKKARSLETLRFQLRNADLELQKKEHDIAAAQEQLNRLLSFRDKLQSPLTEQVKIKADATKTGRRTGSGDPEYIFSLWVEAKQPFLQEISSVEYRFLNSSFKHPIERSQDSSTGFRVQYKGWGCMEVVPVTINSKSESLPGGTLDFNMCSQLKDFD